MAAPMFTFSGIFRRFLVKNSIHSFHVAASTLRIVPTINNLLIHPPSCCLCYDARSIPEVIPKKGVLTFDTHAAVKLLENNGFTTQQSEAVVSLILQIMSAGSENNTRTMVTKEQQEIMLQQVMAQIASVKKDMIILEKSEFSALRNETDKVQIELKKLKESMGDELIKLKGNMLLDINLERSRAVEAHSESVAQLHAADHKIDNEVANLETKFERYRNDIFKYAGGTILSCLTITLGFYRIWN